jgi:phosphatidate cytidylyltransferase
MRRLVTAVALMAVAVYLIFLAPNWVFFLGALLLSVLCYREFSDLAAAHGFHRPGAFGLLMGVNLLFWPEYAVVGFSILLIIATALFLRRDNLHDVLPDISSTIFGAVYTFAPWEFAAKLRAESVHLLFFAVALNWVGDTAAFYVGRRFGKHRLAPVVSPKKSWEGAAASVGASVVFGFVYFRALLPAIPLWHVALMAILGNIAGQFGDLTESAFKRGANVKDSGNLLPGHGGMLDRVDSSLFALPVVYGTHSLLNFLAT